MPQRSCEDRADTLVVLDFETTGLSPDHGDRAIEIGAVLIEQGHVTRRFQSLMNPGFRVSSFIEDYTGISNSMLSKAPPCSAVMPELADFLGNHNLVAHNAAFDHRFLDAELTRVDAGYGGVFVCSMLVARRVYRDIPNHKLGSLVAHENIPNDGTFHRALADCEMTAQLWLRMLDRLVQRYSIATPSFTLMQKIARTPRKSLNGLLAGARVDRSTVRSEPAKG